PELVAVNIAVGGRHEWQAMVAGEEMTEDSFATPELLRRLSAEDSEVKTWAPGVADSDTPRTAGPSRLLFPIQGRRSVLGHVFVQRPRLSPMPPAMQHYLALLATQAGLVCENLQLAALRLAQKVIEQELLQARQIQIELFPTTTDVDARLDAYAVNLPS